MRSVNFGTQRLISRQTTSKILEIQMGLVSLEHPFLNYSFMTLYCMPSAFHGLDMDGFCLVCNIVQPMCNGFATMNLIPFITFLIYNKTHMRSIQSEEKQFLGFEILL